MKNRFLFIIIILSIYLAYYKKEVFVKNQKAPEVATIELKLKTIKVEPITTKTDPPLQIKKPIPSESYEPTSGTQSTDEYVDKLQLQTVLPETGQELYISITPEQIRNMESGEPAFGYLDQEIDLSYLIKEFYRSKNNYYEE